MENKSIEEIADRRLQPCLAYRLRHSEKRRTAMGIFSLNLNKPVEVWFKIEVTEQTKTMDIDKYFSAKIGKMPVSE